MIAQKDRQTYIDRSVMVNMMLLRKTFAEKAMTGAILRVVRALIGLKGTYTIAELKKPFAISRVTFSPDYSNPEVRNAMLSQGMNSMGNMFGTTSVPVIGETTEPHHIDAFNPEEFADNAALLSEHEENPIEDFAGNAVENTIPTENLTPPPSDYDSLICSGCGREITKTVFDFSTKKFGQPLCMSCQKGEQ